LDFVQTLQKIRFNLARRIAPQGESFRFPITYAGSNRYGLVDRQGNQSEMIKAFRSLTFSCVNVRAKDIANAGRLGKFRVKIERGIDVYEDPPMNHPLVQLLRKPNPYITRWFMWYLTATYLDLTGNSYWWIARNKMNVPMQLWPLPSNVVKIMPGNTKAGEEIIKSYIVSFPGGDPQEVAANDIVHLKHPNPADPYYYGNSLVMKAATEIDIDDFIAQHQREFFKNDAVPASVVQFPTKLDKDMRLAFEDQWIKKFNGKPGQVGFLEGGATISNLVEKKEIAFLESRGINLKVIIAVFGVPAYKLGMEDLSAATATMEKLDSVYMSTTIDPFLSMIDEQLTIDLASEFDDKLIITHDSVIPKDLLLQSQLDTADLAMGKVSINELRERDGYDPTPGGDEPLVSSILVPLSLVGAGMAPEEPPPAEPPAKIMRSVDPLSEDGRAKGWKSHSKLQGKIERKMTAGLKEFFDRVKKKCVQHIEAQKELTGVQTKSTLTSDDYMIDLDAFYLELENLVGAQAADALRIAFQNFTDQYAVDGVVFSPNDPLVKDGIAQLAAKTKDIMDTLKSDLARQIDLGIQNQETVQQIADRVSQFFGRTTDFRSIRIARTNANFSVNEGNRIAAVNSGIFDRKIWVDQRDELVRKIHRAMDGIIVALEELFILPNGDKLRIPGDPMAAYAESVANCRCTTMYLMSEKALRYISQHCKNGRINVIEYQEYIRSAA
jgi:HK97 family phage portal protein